MNTRNAFWTGVTAGLVLSLAGIGGHWLITPMRHPDATHLEIAFAWLLFLGGIGGFILLVLRAAKESAN